MNILCSCDNNYAPYCGIMLTSLFENNRESEVVVYILTNKVSEENMRRFRKLAESYGQTIRFIEVSDKKTKDFPLWEGDHVSMATYYRLFITSILPADVEKILYLDCDIIVNRSVKELYNTNLDNKSIGAVVDNSWEWIGSRDFLGLNKETLYFNAGVMLINLGYWRKHELLQKFINFGNSNREELQYHDQDILNAVLANTVEYLPIVYNYQTVFGLKGYQLPPSIPAIEKDKQKENIVIIHYCTPVKPWSCWHFAYPFDNVWQRYKKRSLWADTKYKQPWKQRINCWMVKVLCRSGIKEIEL